MSKGSRSPSGGTRNPTRRWYSVEPNYVIRVGQLVSRPPSAGVLIVSPDQSRPMPSDDCHAHRRRIAMRCFSVALVLIGVAGAGHRCGSDHVPEYPRWDE
jgi:hypothetical protein